MKEMCELWRYAKSRLVTQLNKLPNEEERLKLKPNNIKLEAEWKAFVREKTSKKFQVTLNFNTLINHIYNGLQSYAYY